MGPRASSPEPFNNPFAALKPILDELPPGTLAPAPEEEAPPSRRVANRAVVRLERKGHHGKMVTIVSDLGLPENELQHWLKDLRQTLGCGGTVDGDVLMLQGDQRDRLRSVLAERGVSDLSIR